MSIPRATLHGSLVLLSLLLSAAVLADEAPQPPQPLESEKKPPSSQRARSESSRIEEIVVTGRRRDEMLQKTPVSIVAFESNDLEARGLTQIDDLGRNVAGLKFDTIPGTNNTARIFIRGVGQVSGSDELDPGVAVYVDGVYYPRLLGSVISLLDLERVEVLRGPQGTLFGKNAVGGAVQLVTRKPGSELRGRAQLRVGNRDLLETQASFDVPLVPERVFSRISLATATDDGFVKNVVDGATTGDNKLLAGRAALRVLPADDLELGLSFERSREHEKAPIAECRQQPVLALSLGGVDNVAFAREACQESSLGTSEFKSFSNDPIKNQLEVVGTTGSFAWTLGAVTLKGTSSWRQVANRGSGGDLDYTSVELVGAGPSKLKADTVSHELVAQVQALDDRLFVTTGLYWLREESRARNEQTVQRGVIANPDTPLVGSFAEPDDAPVVAIAGPMPTFRLIDGPFARLLNPLNDPNVLTPLETLRDFNRLEIEKFTTFTYAGFGEITFRVSDGLSLTAGARYTEERRDRRRMSVPVLGVALKADGTPKPLSLPSRGGADARFDEWSARATLAYELNDDVLLFAGYSNGFKSGGFADSELSDQAAAIEPFDTEKLDSYEVGIKSSWLSNRLVANLTGFYNDYDNIQLSINTLSRRGFAITTIQNAGKAVVRGLELELIGRPSWIDGLTLSGGLSLIDADYRSYRESVVPDFQSDLCTSLRLADCPLNDLLAIVNQLTQIRPQMNVDVSDRKFSNTPAASFNLRAEYVLEVGRFGRVLPSVGWYHQGNVFQDVRNTPGARQSKFGLLSARMTWELADGRTAIALFGRNLLDRRYIAGSFDARQQTGQTQVFYSQPRTYGIEIVRTFGGS
jgi:iron complex outermembrane recepter protein